MAIPMATANQIPHAPQLTNDAILIVFVHYSAPSGVQHPVFGDCDRLAQLGRRMLAAAYSDAMRRTFPNLPGNDLAAHINGTFPNFVARWVTTYGWRARMQGVPPNVNLQDQQETLRIFETYVGAVVAQQPEGPAVLSDWIWRLVNTP